MKNDPWAGRSNKMKCKSCMAYAPKDNRLGRCRRHAPTMNGYPVVFIEDWCMDHKLDEEYMRYEYLNCLENQIEEQQSGSKPYKDMEPIDEYMDNPLIKPIAEYEHMLKGVEDAVDPDPQDRVKFGKCRPKWGSISDMVNGSGEILNDF